MKPSVRMHGGADGFGEIDFDFSANTNSDAPTSALKAVANVDSSRYPDASYSELRHTLAQFHGVDTKRILLACSASEFIGRFTAWAHLQGWKHVYLPKHAYGDYAHAAAVWGMQSSTELDQHLDAECMPQWQWCCDPSSPLGQSDDSWITASATRCVVLDCAYTPLRLNLADPTRQQALDRVWQLWTPNKALGLTGIRAAYVIAPVGAQAACLQLNALCPSWPIGSHGVAMLMAWTEAQVQVELAQGRITLLDWKQRQIQLCERLGWQCLPSETNFFVAKPPLLIRDHHVEAWRKRGIKLRDCASFGLPNHWRMSVQPLGAQDALAQALSEMSA